MADEVLGIVTENLSSFVREQLALFFGVNEEIERLSSTLTTINAVLEDAEEQQITNRAIKDWLRRLKYAAYVLDDILDECSIKSARSRREGNGSVSQNEDHNMSLCSLNPKFTLFRYKVAKRLKKISKRLDGIAQERQNFHLVERTTERRVEVPEWRQTISIINQSVVYGRDEDREKIVDLLLRQASESDELSIYSIIGIGGLGKTTLAQAVFNDERVSNHFDLKIWVCVSEDFSLKRVLECIIESYTGQHSNLTNLDTLQKRVQELLQSKKYLVVLDDVWNENQEKWDRLKSVLNCGSKGASILVTTRLRIVATIWKHAQLFTCQDYQRMIIGHCSNNVHSRHPGKSVQSL